MNRFGIGEWYGKSFIHLTPSERQDFVRRARDKRLTQPLCIPRLMENQSQRCTKKGGVCSIRKYELSDGIVGAARDREGRLTTTCPHRFKENNMVFQLAGEYVLETAAPLMVKEVGFLEQLPIQDVVEEEDTVNNRPVGKIDMVLVHPDNLSSWCALEMQAVYFSGDSMNQEFDALADFQGPGLPFPVGRRRPDYRSSGPKRLMPQLQIKVPTLRNWGKKMVVVVDENFFRAMGNMDRERDMASCNIVWLIVRYNEQRGQSGLEIADVSYTTLDRAIEGLTAGNPVPLAEFENRIREKLGR